MVEPPEMTLKHSETWVAPAIPEKMFRVPLSMASVPSGRDWWRIGGIARTIRKVLKLLLNEVWISPDPPVMAVVHPEEWNAPAPPVMIKKFEEPWSE